MPITVLRAFCWCLALLGLSPVAAHAAYYGNTPTTFSWIDPVAGGHAVATWTNGASCTGGTYVTAPADDDITTQLPIGFNFNFGGTTYNQLQIMTNGRLQFNNSYCGYGTNGVGPPPTYPYDFPTGNPLGGNVVRMMRIYGADFDPSASAPTGRVYYATAGIAPNRTFTVTWFNVTEWNSPGSFFNMQIILRENGEFVYQYKDTVNLTTGHAQIGWEVSAADYDIYNYSGFGTLAYSAIRFYPAPVKLGEWRMDELTWTGAAGEVVDSSGNGRNAQAVNGAVTASAAPAIAVNPGTCRYGVFDGVNDHVLLPASFPNMTQSFTITAWINTQNRTRAGQRILVDDETNSGGYGFSLGDGGAGMLRFYSRASAPVILDTTAVIQNNLWYFVAAVADIAGGRKTIYVYDASGALLTSATSTFTGAWGTDAGAASIGGETSASSESSLKFFGNIDEVKVLSGAVPQTTLDILARETHLCPITGATLGGFNVFESSTPAGSVAGYIKTKTAGRRFDTTTGNLAIVALSAGVIDNSFNNTVKVEVLNAAAGGALDTSGCNAAWPVVATLANQAVSGGRVNLSTIPQINALAYPNLKVRVSFPTVGAVTRYGCSNDSFALRPDNLVLSNPTHEILPASWAINPDATAGNTGTALINASATGGEVHKAGRNFSLRALARDALGNVITNYAGSPVGGVSALSLPTPASCPTCVPGVITVGGWGPITPPGTVTGTVVSDTATYSEAGSIAIHVEDRSFAAIDGADSTAGERYVDSNVVNNVGRFIPDHFDIATLVTPVFRTFNSTDLSCSAGAAPRRSFTYIGQRFGYSTLPQATIIARNFANVTTALYRGTLWKLGSGAGAAAVATCNTVTCTLNSTVGTTTFSNAYTYTLNPAVGVVWDTALPTTGIPSVAANNDGTGTLSFTSGDQLAFNRPAAPVADFTASINASIALVDASETGGTITTTNPAQFNAIAFDATYVGPPAQANRFFFGRLRLDNAYGSQLLSMPVPMKAQYWNGTAFITNTLDNCTTIALANIALGNYQRNLNAGETVVTVGGAFSAGVGSLRLSAPGNANNGSVDVSVNLTGVAAGASCTPGMPASTGANLTHLQGLWCTPPGTYASDPTARATFGIYRNPIIFQRENF